MPDANVLVESLRKDWLNYKTAHPDGAKCRAYEIRDARDRTLAPYNWDPTRIMCARCGSPFSSKSRAPTGFLFVIRDTTAPCAVPWKMRRTSLRALYWNSGWDGKSGGGDQCLTQAGALGRFGMNHHLRWSLVFLIVRAMPELEAYFGAAANLFEAQGKLTNESTCDFLRKFAESFAASIEAIGSGQIDELEEAMAQMASFLATLAWLQQQP